MVNTFAGRKQLRCQSPAMASALAAMVVASLFFCQAVAKRLFPSSRVERGSFGRQELLFSPVGIADSRV